MAPHMFGMKRFTPELAAALTMFKSAVTSGLIFSVRMTVETSFS
jgi:hypothetical protein